MNQVTTLTVSTLEQISHRGKLVPVGTELEMDEREVLRLLDRVPPVICLVETDSQTFAGGVSDPAQEPDQVAIGFVVDADNLITEPIAEPVPEPIAEPAPEVIAEPSAEAPAQTQAKARAKKAQ